MPNLRGSEWLIIVLLIALLFGAKRLPEAARGLGRSLRIFKAETKGLATDDQPAPAPVVPSATPLIDPIVTPAEPLPSAAPPAPAPAPQPPASA